MSQLSIHPQTNGAPLTMSGRAYSPSNSNSVRLTFSSHEYNDKASIGIFTVDDEITLFDLDAATAELLGIVSQLNIEQRAAILPAARHALAEQNAEE
jgi:hypothetical protein